MARRKRTSADRFRVGKVTVYLHHGAWWLYYSEVGERVRRKVSESRPEAEKVAAQVNSQVAQGAPTLLSFQPISVPELRRQFLDYHEHVLKSSVGTLSRYKAATQHLEDFTSQGKTRPHAHEVRPDAFATYLRKIEVSPNGHRNTKKRKLRDKGVQFILETSRSMYNFAVKRRHLPPYAGNPFSELPLDRLKIEDAKAIFVFDAATELAFLKAASAWAFPIHFTLAKTGLRIGELTHLLIEDLDLDGGWLQVRNKTELGWRIKTGHERPVPLLPEVVAVLRKVIAKRTAGPVFVRPKLVETNPKLIGTTSAGVLDHALRLFQQTFGFALEQADAGRRALHGVQGEVDVRPSGFVASGAPAEVAWATDAANLVHLGNEFLLWLWFVLECEGDTLPLGDGSEVAVMMAKTLVLECPRGVSGSETIRSAGPSKLPEARRAIQAGKLPRQAGLILVRHSAQYELTLQAETLAVSAARLPPSEEKDRAALEERIGQVRHLVETVDLLYDAFTKRRLGAGWPAELGRVQRWLQREGGPQAAEAA